MSAANLHGQLSRLQQKFLALVEEVDAELRRVYASGREAEEEARRFQSPERMAVLRAARDEKAGAARRDAAAKLRPLSEEFDRAKARVDDVYRSTFDAAGDGGSDARQNVQRLLDRGVAPGSIIDRAREAADGVGLLKALRVEVPWLMGSGVLGADLFTPGELPGLMEASEQTLAEISTGEEGEAMKKAVQLAGAAETATRAQWLALNATTGSGGHHGPNRLAFAYAQEAEGGAGSE